MPDARVEARRLDRANRIEEARRQRYVGTVDRHRERDFGHHLAAAQDAVEKLLAFGEHGLDWRRGRTDERELRAFDVRLVQPRHAAIELGGLGIGFRAQRIKDLQRRLAAGRVAFEVGDRNLGRRPQDVRIAVGQEVRRVLIGEVGRALVVDKCKVDVARGIAGIQIGAGPVANGEQALFRDVVLVVGDEHDIVGVVMQRDRIQVRTARSATRQRNVVRPATQRERRILLHFAGAQAGIDQSLGLGEDLLRRHRGIGNEAKERAFGLGIDERRLRAAGGDVVGLVVGDLDQRINRLADIFYRRPATIGPRLKPNVVPNRTSSIGRPLVTAWRTAKSNDRVSRTCQIEPMRPDIVCDRLTSSS